LPILNTTGDHIRRRRLELGLLQRNVAKALGVSISTVTNWEKHRTEPQLYLIPRIIEFLGYDPFSSYSKSVGQKLLQYRKSNGISQKELSGRMGIDPKTLSRMARGRGRCFRSVLEKVSAFLDRERNKVVCYHDALTGSLHHM
jgi:transcriptional regulator with XRE-family HTH domain